LSTRPRKKYWVRLSDGEAEFLEELRKRIGAPTVGEALRFLVQYNKWMTEGRLILLPKEVVSFLRSAENEGGERKGEEKLE